MRTRRQRLGQHFLHDDRTARAIVAALDAEPDRVVEIGPGRGALTRLLIERFGQVAAVELDPDLAAMLPNRLGRPAGLEVLRLDAVTADLDAIARGGRWQVAANLPYSVGTAIVRRLLARPDLFSTLVVMVQLEVAQRLVAPPGASARGLLSVEAEARADAELLFTVAPRCFVPPPRVTSAVVRMALRPPPAPDGRLERALGIAARAFTHRRKTLANALAGAAPPAEIAAAIAAGAIPANARPQDLALRDWLTLARALPADAPGRARARRARAEGA
ncbi:MAG TPA: 16S rRNA (adenine(1518)-N(6)/adenine(1519)-N(6))-dimethyltransferase RsmA [Thermoanaerobaculaceae bacterium]|nr:16S rRNA (adenine(1518)-N(6)/adenine(1519)-N(6))-dimethyltransferase RsmA [Thermoanaerobaculaceae bacterium]